MATSKPFKIKVNDDDLEQLKKKLELARLPDQPGGYNTKQGIPVPEIARVLEHWKTDFLPRWRQHEAKLNELPMFTRAVQTDGFGTLDIHFIHKRSDVQGAIPLLFVHGWPGSFIEKFPRCHDFEGGSDEKILRRCSFKCRRCSSYRCLIPPTEVGYLTFLLGETNAAPNDWGSIKLCLDPTALTSWFALPRSDT